MRLRIWFLLFFTAAGISQTHLLRSPWAQELIAADGADVSGVSVSVSGDTALVGTRSPVGMPGAAYVFVRRGAEWVAQQKLTASGGGWDDGFGHAVSLCGNTAAIGTLHSNVTYIFVRRAGVWSEQQQLPVSGRVAVSGDTLLVADSRRRVATVFVRHDRWWSRQQELTGADGAGDEGFGDSIALSGDTAWIGAPGWNGGQGAAYVFARDGEIWSQSQRLSASEGGPGAGFGGALSVSGEAGWIGASGWNDGRGAVYRFECGGGIWNERQKLMESGGAAATGFGASIAASVDTAVIGSAGTVSLFGRNSGMWTQQDVVSVGIPAKANADSGGNANGIPGRRRTVLGA